MEINRLPALLNLGKGYFYITHATVNRDITYLFNGEEPIMPLEEAKYGTFIYLDEIQEAFSERLTNVMETQNNS